jgi:hypothetical protein
MNAVPLSVGIGQTRLSAVDAESTKIWSAGTGAPDSGMTDSVTEGHKGQIWNDRFFC